MQRAIRAILVSIVIAVLGSVSCSALTSVTPDEITAWTRRTIPLPKQMQILGKVQVQCAGVSIVLPTSTDIKIPQARKELRTALGLPEEGDNPANPTFTITLQLGGSESTDLNVLANSAQAYKIFAEPNDAGLRLVALQPAGLYYAAKTLVQMLPWRVASGSVQIPVVQILDWPDMADRGLWGCDHFAWLKWMGDRKMNIGEQISTCSVTSDGIGHSGLKPGRETMVTEGPYYGVKPCPATFHLSSVGDSGLFQYYPQLIGVNGIAGTICYSRPEFPPVLADWICDLASLPYVDEVDVWMTEDLHNNFGPGCKCAQCLAGNRSVLETQAIVTAFDIVKQRLAPRSLVFRILTGQQSEPDNAACFAATSPEVKWWYYNGDVTYSCGRRPIISDAVANLAASGRYAGVCPMIGNLKIWEPFESAEFVNYRMSEFQSKHLSGIIGYAVPPPLVPFVGFNVEAEAEWAWNMNGRTTHEFAVSYAVRKGYADPEKFAQWADAIGRLEFDLYGSEWPDCDGKYWLGYVADLLQKGTLPALGTSSPDQGGPWGEFKTAQRLDDDMALAAKALSLAKEMGNSEHYYESVYADGLITSLRALYKLKGLVVGGTVSSANRETARYYFGVYINSLRQSIDAVQNWCIVVDNTSDRVSGTVTRMQACIDGNGGTNPGMQAVAVNCGCTPTLPYISEPAVTIADAKRLGVGAIVNLYGDLVTGSYGTTGFLQERNRSAAIRIRTSSSLTTSAPAMAFGTVENTNGELVVNADVVQNTGSAELVAPLAMPLRSLGGGAFGGQPAVMEYRPAGQLHAMVGLSNMGLFVRVAGIVTYVGSDYFYIDDGSRCNDDSGNSGVRVICADGAWSKPAVGEYVTVNGMSSAYSERGSTWKALYVPAQTNIVLMPVPLEIILDEDQATLTGSWTYTTSAAGAAYHDDYDFTTTAGVENGTVRWTPNFGRAGAYDVYVMYCSGSDRTIAAPYTVNYSGGSQTYTVNQTSGGGAWQLLGRMYFAAGTGGYVQLGNATSDAGKAVVADAVKFVRVSTGTPPTITGQPASQAVCLGSTATFAVTASGSSPLSYLWRKGAVNIADGGHYSGATTATLTITGCSSSDAAANYNCVVSNVYGTVTSNSASLTVGDAQLVPTALTATNVGNETIAWNWTSVTGATGYKMWTAASGGTQIGGTITGTSYTESAMDPGKSYTRYVEAWSGCGAALTRTQLGPTSTVARYCVQNGNFESGFTSGIGNYWIKGSGSGTFAQSTSIKRDGASSQMLYDAVVGDAFTAWEYQKINVQSNHNYTVKAWHRREVTNGCVTEIGVSYNGGVTPDIDYDGWGTAGVWTLESYNFTSGATGLVTVMFRAGANGGDSNGYIDGVYVIPQAPTTTGGSKTISAGGSATITASGGFAGTNSELHWYTGAAGTGTHVGTGTSLLVSPTVTTRYYPRWESSLSGSCPSDDGAAVTVTVN